MSTYLFNSQLLSRDDRSMVLVLPGVSGTRRVWCYLNELLSADNPISELKVFDLRESWALRRRTGGSLRSYGGIDTRRTPGGESGGDDERYLV
ncbi:N-succinylarginine dihydrolase [Shigella flexneri]